MAGPTTEKAIDLAILTELEARERERQGQLIGAERLRGTIPTRLERQGFDSIDVAVILESVNRAMNTMELNLNGGLRHD